MKRWISREGSLDAEWKGEQESQCRENIMKDLMSVGASDHIVSWEPQGHYHNSTMFHWEPEGQYRCTKSIAIVPFCFLMEHLWIVIAPFWFSADDIKVLRRWLSSPHYIGDGEIWDGNRRKEQEKRNVRKLVSWTDDIYVGSENLQASFLL